MFRLKDGRLQVVYDDKAAGCLRILELDTPESGLILSKDGVKPLPVDYIRKEVMEDEDDGREKLSKDGNYF